MDEVVLKIIAAAATGDELQVLQASLNAMRKLENKDHRIVLFESHSSSDEGGNFQCGPCTMARNGVIMNS